MYPNESVWLQFLRNRADRFPSFGHLPFGITSAATFTAASPPCPFGFFRCFTRRPSQFRRFRSRLISGKTLDTIR
jgi:hypothetical protein